MLASLVENIVSMRTILLEVLILIMMVAVGFKVFSDDRSNSLVVTVASLLYTACILAIYFHVFSLLFGYGGDKPKHHGTSHHKGGSGIHIHLTATDWKAIWITLAVCALIVLTVVGFLVYRKWYNSPEKVEARAALENETLQRIEHGIGDNPDILQLTIWLREMKGKTSPKAAKLREDAARLLRQLMVEEEDAALDPIAIGIEDIKFRNDPAQMADVAEQAQDD